MTEEMLKYKEVFDVELKSPSDVIISSILDSEEFRKAIKLIKTKEQRLYFLGEVMTELNHQSLVAMMNNQD